MCSGCYTLVRFMDHQEARRAQRLRLPGFVECIHDLQCWALSVMKIEHCYLKVVAEADQLSFVTQRTHKIERSACLEFNRGRCLNLCRICDIENGKSRAFLLLNVQVRLVSSLIQEERLPWRLRHLRKICRLLNDEIAQVGLDLRVNR